MSQHMHKHVIFVPCFVFTWIIRTGPLCRFSICERLTGLFALQSSDGQSPTPSKHFLTNSLAKSFMRNEIMFKTETGRTGIAFEWLLPCMSYNMHSDIGLSRWFVTTEVIRTVPMFVLFRSANGFGIWNILRVFSNIKFTFGFGFDLRFLMFSNLIYTVFILILIG